MPPTPTAPADGGPAFPRPGFTTDRKMPHANAAEGGFANTQQDGMTMRQYYLGKIMAGFCANPAIFAANGRSGWGLVNCQDHELVGYADKLACDMVACAAQRSAPRLGGTGG